MFPKIYLVLVAAQTARCMYPTNSKMFWPNATVYYEISQGILDHEMIYPAVTYALQYINSLSCLKWVPKDAGTTHYVTFLLENDSEDRTVCEASVGYSRRPKIQLGHWCFQTLVTGYPRIHRAMQRHAVLHEMVHVMGFHHEHQRKDRDCYVRFGPPLRNIPNFNKKDPKEYKTNWPYDYVSVTHYSDSKVADILEPNDYSISPLGRLDDLLSEFDIWKLQSIYCGRPYFCVDQPHVCEFVKKDERWNANCTLFA